MVDIKLFKLLLFILLKKSAIYSIKVKQYSKGIPFTDFVLKANNITIELSKVGQV